MDYDENLPEYYNNNHRFLWDKMDKNMLTKSKLFEKIEIEWFTPEMMKKRIHEFRPFYREIVESMLKQKASIMRTLTKNATRKRSKKSANKTRVRQRMSS